MQTRATRPFNVHGIDQLACRAAVHVSHDGRPVPGRTREGSNVHRHRCLAHSFADNPVRTGVGVIELIQGLNNWHR
jgi:hypothetical protein